MTDAQTAYRDTYAALSKRGRIGRDEDGDTEADQMRTLLHRLWLSMCPLERQIFLSPGVLDRHAEGPVCDRFRRPAKKRGDMVRSRVVRKVGMEDR